MDYDALRCHITDPKWYFGPFSLLADSCTTLQVKLSLQLEKSALQMSGMGPHAARGDKRAEFLFIIIHAKQLQ